MRIHTLNINRFRNLHDFTLDLCDGVNLLYGENGHGKTNLLESIAIAINGKTPRASRIYEIIPHDSDYAKWGLEFEVEDVHTRVECIVQNGQMKKLLVDGQAKKKLPGSDRGVYALTFFPEDFQILTGEPFFRRKFLDETILLTEPSYARILKSYRDAYAARNAMLKSSQSRPASFEPYEELLSINGIEITKRRTRIIEELQNKLTELSESVFENEITLGLGYVPNLKELIESENAVMSLKASYSENRSRDMAIKRTMMGPHRDDFNAYFRNEDIRKFSSRGETRLSVVALIIAKYYILRNRWDLNPVILLDDIFSELDQSRRQRVLKALPDNCQLLITAVDKDLSRRWLDEMRKVASFRVVDGLITRD